ncbi:TVP38/TMEM64 family protein [uncultured Phascolarctobacterium sp.]|uniref:TVP38/TMEM64 family protein n=1 Tax=uncultured Phascolarctobacterium sp. TaxID=512296 RepID=UPI0025FFC548|nr:TVP38/TMEM64 family protein [uncultured Phascolarctobacterium sp.]
MNKIKDWLEKPDIVTKIAVALLLTLLLLCIHCFAHDFFTNTFKLAISGNVNGLAAYLRSFGPWAMVISFILDVLINAGSVFPSIFLSTANGLLFGLPMGILISWLAETTGVVISFYLMRFFFRSAAEKLIEKSNSLKAIDEASGKHGLEWMAFARALPYFPSGILTAVGAVSSISARDYIIANLIGKFPSTALEVVIGHDVVNYQQNSYRLAILVVIVALIFFAYSRYRRK